MAMRQHMLKWILLIVMVLMSTSVFAKGAAERIVITGPTLGEEIIVDDAEMTRLLSMGQVEAFGEGEIPEPENLGEEWYELARQYEPTPGQFQTFDRLQYHPNPDGGRGYIFYVGIVNGSSGYDNNWYYVTTAGEAAIRRVLSGQSVAYAPVLINDMGMLYRIDPLTLEDVSSVQIGGENTIISRFTTTYDGQQAFFTTAPSNDVVAEQRVLNPDAGVNCRVSDRHMFILELPSSGHLLFGSDFGTLQIRDRDTMEIIDTFTAPANYDRAQYFPSRDGMTMYVLSISEYGLLLTLYDAATERFVIATNLGDVLHGDNYQGMWSADYATFYLTDGHTLAEVTYNIWERIPRLNFYLRPLPMSRVDMGVQFMPAIGHQGWIYFHNALGRDWEIDDSVAANVPGGIYRAYPWGDEVVEHWHIRIPFTQVMMGGDFIYAISAPADTNRTTLYRLGFEDGEILASREFARGRWRLAYVRLDEDFGQGDSFEAANCDGLNVAGRSQ